MKQFIYLMCAASLVAATFTSCSDDDPQPANPAGSVEVTDQGTVTRFYLANPTDTYLSEPVEVVFDVVNTAEETTVSFTGNVVSVDNQIVDGQRNTLECTMVLGEDRLADGYYFVSVLVDGELRYGPFYISVKDHSITPVKCTQFSYSALKGAGTKESPYKIASRENFEYFLKSLKEDMFQGYGQYFELTSDITLSPYTDDLSLMDAVFQGTFNGNNHTITGLKYDGSRHLPKADVGLFSRLSNAELYDLTLDEVMINAVHANGGAIAGSAKGRVVLSNVSVNGCVYGDLNIGGLIGSVDGELHISGGHTDVILMGGARTGGLIGAFAHLGSGTSEFSDVHVSGQVYGTSYTGGMIGLLKAEKTPRIGGMNVDTYVKGTEDVGGFIGNIYKCTVEFTADNLFNGSRAPRYSVEGTTNVGGFAGTLDLDNKNSLVIDPYALNLNIGVHATERNAGGVIGLAKDGTIKMYKINVNYPNSIVTSDGENAGGFIGRMESVYLKGGHTVNDKKELPQPGTYTPRVAIPVNGVTCVGGAVGTALWSDGADAVSHCGGIYGIVSKCDVKASGEIAGGIVGWLTGQMNDCVSLGSVQSASSGIVGGVIGKAETYVNVEKCINHSSITGGKYQGGICGYANPAKKNGDEWWTYFISCYNIGNLTDGMTVGGIVGYAGQKDGNCKLLIRMCENYGTVMAAGNGDHSVGGVVGDVDNNLAIVEWSANYANVGSKKVQFTIGGVVGKIGRDQVLMNDVHVTGCTNLGTITCDDYATKLGGVVGQMMRGDSGYLSGCVNWGSIPGDQKSDTGGILGCASLFNYIHRNWNKGMVSHGNAIIGTHTSGSSVSHSYNYYLEGTGANWPDAESVAPNRITVQSSFPHFPWGPGQDYVGYTGEWYLMSSEGPIPMSFDFIHWDVERLRPAGWHINR